MHRSGRAILSLILGLSLVAGACGSDTGDTVATATTAAPATTVASAVETTASSGGETTASSEGELAGVCPATVVIQTDWFPESEHGGMYEMVGDDYVIDGENQTMTGSLMASGVDTGVDVQVRAGGPAIGYQNTVAQMYTDTDITLAYADTDSVAFFWDDAPVIQVVTPLDKNPQILMWDPEVHPNIHTIADLGETDVTVSVFGGGTWTQLFIAEGVLSEDQVDPSYDGSPARFIAEGNIAQQGYASAEPWDYKHKYSEFGKDVRFQLVHDAGFEVYKSALSVRADEIDEMAPCLEKLVPIIQQAQVDFMADPGRTNAMIIEMVETIGSFWTYDEGIAAYSVQSQSDLGLVSNGPNGALGDFIDERTNAVLDQMRSAGMDIPAGLSASDMSTNRFIDYNIGLPGGAETAAGLAGVCPATVVIQTDWFPESEHGGMYEMVGDDYVIDGENQTTTGSLMASGVDTGVDVQVRAGGPAIGYQNTVAQMYTDTDITLAYADTDSIAFFWDDAPVIQVVTPLDKNPQILMWDPEVHPNIHTIADLGETDVTVSVFGGGTWTQLFIAEGVLSEDQVDPSYDGSPARFIAEGNIAQQGYASAEPWDYKHKYSEFGKDVRFQLVHDAGFEVYKSALAVRADEIDEMAPCLEKLVPIIQQAQVDFMADPGRTNAMIIEMVETIGSFWTYDEGIAAYSVQSQSDLGLVSNGPNGALGDFIDERTNAVLDQMRSAGMDIPAGLSASDMSTNRFIDYNIGLPGGAETAAGLAGVCPATVVIQTDWFPESEHGGMYEMVGDDYVIDGENQTTTGSLMASGVDTGVDVQVRAGGPAIGYQNTVAQMYTDTDITLAYADTDSIAFFWDDAPVIQVVTPLDKNPQILMWDPEVHPNIHTIADLGETDVTVSVFGGGTWTQLFIAEGVLSEDQVDPSYDGSPARFIAEGNIAQQGYASAEPWDYKHKYSEFGKDVRFQLVHDAGFEVYKSALAVRADEIDEMAPCLEKLVPIIQQAQVDFMADPGRTNAMIIEMVETIGSFWTYDEGIAAYSVQSQSDLGLVSNGPNGALGDFIDERTNAVLDQMRSAGMDIPAGLSASDMSTNRFIDYNIGLPG